jgi:hypothetical protein
VPDHIACPQALLDGDTRALGVGDEQDDTGHLFTPLFTPDCFYVHLEIGKIFKKYLRDRHKYDCPSS